MENEVLITKLCRKCGQSYPLTEEFWYWRSNGKRVIPCKTCCKARSRAWNAANPEERRALNQAYYAVRAKKKKQA